MGIAALLAGVCFRPLTDIPDVGLSAERMSAMLTRLGLGQVNFMPTSALKPTIGRIEKAIRSLVRERYPTANVFSFGAVDINPVHLAIWTTTSTDRERDSFSGDQELLCHFRSILLAEGYPPEAVPHVGFAFESEETVKRDYDGNWWHAVK